MQFGEGQLTLDPIHRIDNHDIILIIPLITNFGKLIIIKINFQVV